MDFILTFIRENYLTVMIAGSMLGIGLLFEILIFPRLRKYVLQKDPEHGKVIMGSLRGISFTIALGIGILILINRLELEPPYGIYIRNSLWVVLVLLVTWLVARIVGRLINTTTDRDNSGFSGATIFENVFKIVTYSLGVLVAMQVIGIPIAPIITALGVGGLAVALALQDTLSNLFSGLNIIASKKIRPGDFIRLQSGEEGFVEDINWRTTTLRETADNIVVIPNSKLASAIHKNYNLPDNEVMVGITAMVDYQNDIEKIEQLAVQQMQACIDQLDFCVKNQQPAFRWQQFNDNGLQFSVFLKVTDYSLYGILRHEFMRRFLIACHQQHVRLPRFTVDNAR
ncbi:MAG: mechanosensitive ion channel family protein [Cytophagaceae bacterium]|jgi:small-conductance mechanosensitive channel|nr:mechanosensitive ion channel family protein [Cytophagaceae bacterium]